MVRAVEGICNFTRLQHELELSKAVGCSGFQWFLKDYGKQMTYWFWDIHTHTHTTVENRRKKVFLFLVDE